MIHKMDQNGGISMGFHIIRSKSQDVILNLFYSAHKLQYIQHISMISLCRTSLVLAPASVHVKSARTGHKHFTSCET